MLAVPRPVSRSPAPRVAALVSLCLAATAATALAHPEVSPLALSLELGDGQLRAEIRYDPARLDDPAAEEQADRDGDGVITAAERRALLALRRQQMAARVRLAVDGEPLLAPPPPAGSSPSTIAWTQGEMATACELSIQVATDNPHQRPPVAVRWPDGKTRTWRHRPGTTLRLFLGSSAACQQRAAGALLYEVASALLGIDRREQVYFSPSGSSLR